MVEWHYTCSPGPDWKHVEVKSSLRYPRHVRESQHQAKSRVFWSDITDSIGFVCRTKREIADAKNNIWHWEQNSNQKGNLKFLALHKAVSQTSPKLVRFGHCFWPNVSRSSGLLALPTFLQIDTQPLIGVWEENEEWAAKWQPESAESSVEPRHEWWLGLAFVWRVHARRCLITSAGDLSLPSLLIFCPLKWTSVLRLCSAAVNRELLCASQDPAALFLSARWCGQALYLQIKNTILLIKTKLASNAESINSRDFRPSPVWTVGVQMELSNWVYLNDNFVSSLKVWFYW